MKSALWILAAAAMVISGCDKKAASTTTTTNSAAAYNKAITNNSSGNPLTAPVDYLGTLAKGKQSSEKTIEVASINQAIQLFYAQEGRYPKDLNELVTEKYLPKVPAPPYGMKMSYDSAE